MEFEARNKKKYEWIRATLVEQSYHCLGKADKGLYAFVCVVFKTDFWSRAFRNGFGSATKILKGLFIAFTTLGMQCALGLALDKWSNARAGVDSRTSDCPMNFGQFVSSGVLLGKCTRKH